MPTVSQLIEQLSSPDLAQQSAAWKALLAVGADAVDPLLPLLDHTDDQIRMRAVSLLGQLGDSRALEPLVRCLDDPSGKVHQALVTAFMRFPGQPRAVEALKSLALDSRFALPGSTRAFAARQLKTVAGEAAATAVLLELLQSSDAQTVAAAAQVLAESSDPAVVDALIAALNHAATDSTFRDIATALGKLHDSRAVEPLAAFLQSSSVYRRAIAAYALGELGDERAAGALKALVGDKAFAWEEDHGGPKYTVGDVANEALRKIKKVDKRPFWKRW